MIVLLAPSKTQETGHGYSDFTLPQMLDRTEVLVEKLQRLSIDEIMELMQVSEKLAQTTHKRFAGFIFPPKRQLCSPALLAFRGDVFSQIEADNYNEEDFQFAQDHLRILSGLYGILRPLDLIQPYRLEMGGKFKPRKNTTLYQYWRKGIEAVLNNLVAQQHQEIVNLASQEYYKAIRPQKIAARIITVFFQQRRGQKLRTVAIHAKRARGALANHIITNRLQTSKQLREFSYQGYTFEASRSTSDELVYVNEGGARENI